jgi:hypothetical protein
VKPAGKKLYAASILLFAFGAAGHAFIGTLMMRPWTETATLWSFSGSVAAWAIAALNWLSMSREDDLALAAWAFAGAIAWIGLMFWLMPIADMWGDVRPWLFVAECAVMGAFALATIRRGLAESVSP